MKHSGGAFSGAAQIPSDNAQPAQPGPLRKSPERTDWLQIGCGGPAANIGANC
jgi:hypothetical protein